PHRTSRRRRAVARERTPGVATQDVGLRRVGHRARRAGCPSYTVRTQRDGPDCSGGDGVSRPQGSPTPGVELGGESIGDRHLSLRDQVLAELRTRIIDAQYRPGERLTEDRLAADFGVSRNPVREALRVVEA